MVEDVRVVIVGAGPAGMASGIFLQRAGLDPVLLEKGVPGGLLRSANLVENYPGFPQGIPGRRLVGRFKSHMLRTGLKPTKALVTRATHSRHSFLVETDTKSFRSKVLIVASGTKPVWMHIRSSGIPSETRIFSEITDVPRTLLRGRRAIVVGGGDAAFDYALNLAGSGDGVTILSRSAPCCLPLLQERAERLGVEVLVGHSLESVSTPSGSAEIECKMHESRKALKADFILMACGRTQEAGFLDPELKRSISGNTAPETSVPGFFVAGDVARGEHRQTAIAVGDGVRAAMLAQDFLKTKEGRR